MVILHNISASDLKYAGAKAAACGLLRMVNRFLFL